MIGILLWLILIVGQLCIANFLSKLPLELYRMTSPQIQSYVEDWQTSQGIVPIIIPLGATEQHGPIGFIGTDSITAEAIATRVATELNILLFPTLPIGMSIHHCGFPGSVSLSPSTYSQVIQDIISSLSTSTHITHFYFVNGHGGNIGPFTLAKETLRLQKQIATRKGLHPASPLINIRLNSWFLLPKAAALARELFATSLGQHATPDEVAITQYLFNQPAVPHPDPEEVMQVYTNRTKRVEASEPLPAWMEELTAEEKGRYVTFYRAACSHMDPEDFKSRWPDGRMGSNSYLASPELGKRLLDTAVDAAIEDLQQFLLVKVVEV